MREVFRPLGTRFEVGGHVLRVWRARGGWASSVDGLSKDETYSTEAEAWEAGVRLIDFLDNPASSALSPV